MKNKIFETKYLFIIMAVVIAVIITPWRVNAEGQTADIVDTSDHTYTYYEMVEDLSLMAAAYPSRISISYIGYSLDQRPILQVVLGNPNAEKAVYIQASTHGREWMNTMMIMKQLEVNLQNWDVLVNGNETYGDLFNKCAIYIVPMVNPDGVTISQYGLDGIINPVLRSNLNAMSGSNNPQRWKANANGVDINNNFSVGWGTRNTSAVPASQGYKGLVPFTEPETIAVAQAVTQRHFEAAISYHSFEGAIYWNVGQQESLLTASAYLAAYISSVTGYKLGVTSSTNGLEYNWMILEKGIPTLVIETGTTSCPLPYSQWSSLWEQNKDVMKALALAYE